MLLRIFQREVERQTRFAMLAFLDLEAALKANGATYTMHMYDGANHGFHNDTTPRYDEAAAKLAWQRTLDHFNKYLRS